MVGHAAPCLKMTSTFCLWSRALHSSAPQCLDSFQFFNPLLVADVRWTFPSRTTCMGHGERESQLSVRSSQHPSMPVVYPYYPPRSPFTPLCRMMMIPPPHQLHTVPYGRTVCLIRLRWLLFSFANDALVQIRYSTG